MLGVIWVQTQNAYYVNAMTVKNKASFTYIDDPALSEPHVVMPSSAAEVNSSTESNANSEG